MEGFACQSVFKAGAGRSRAKPLLGMVVVESIKMVLDGGRAEFGELSLVAVVHHEMKLGGGLVEEPADQLLLNADDAHRRPGPVGQGGDVNAKRGGQVGHEGWGPQAARSTQAKVCCQSSV